MLRKKDKKLLVKKRKWRDNKMKLFLIGVVVGSVMMYFIREILWKKEKEQINLALKAATEIANLLEVKLMARSKE